MKHNIRINGEVKEIDCELGSGILDKNGKEIFEGDRVKFTSGGWVDTVVYDRGEFIMHGTDEPIKPYCGDSLEIVGHVND